MEDKKEAMAQLIRAAKWEVEYHTRELQKSTIKLESLIEKTQADQGPDLFCGQFDTMKELEKLGIQFDPKAEQCPECDGKGTGFFSCCSGDRVDQDAPLCPDCMEHLGEDTCEACEGTGKILNSKKAIK